MTIGPVLAVMGLFLALGSWLRRSGRLSPAAAPRLNGLALNVTVPSGVVLALHRFPLSGPVLLPSAVMAISTLLVWGLGVVTARLMGLGARDRPLLAAAAAFGNTAFIGFPVVRALYGTSGLAEAVLVDQIGSEPLAFTLGAVMAASAGGVVPWRRELAGLLRFPPRWALAFGLILRRGRWRWGRAFCASSCRRPLLWPVRGLPG